MLLINHPELCQFIFFHEIRIVKLYICTGLTNIKNIYIKYSHCGPINFSLYFEIYLKVLNPMFDDSVNWEGIVSSFFKTIYQNIVVLCLVL